jgi:hypothetical protein
MAYTANAIGSLIHLAALPRKRRNERFRLEEAAYFAKSLNVGFGHKFTRGRAPPYSLRIFLKSLEMLLVR